MDAGRNDSVNDNLLEEELEQAIFENNSELIIELVSKLQDKNNYLVQLFASNYLHLNSE